MKKIFPKKERGPMMLMDRVFTIPLFQANTQQYVCTKVAELSSDANSKTYGLYFKWLPTTYSVPEILRMDIEIYKQNVKPHLVNISLYEKTNSGNYVVTCNGHFDEDYISTPAKIQTMIERLIKR
jgi:hypothetical protein